MRTIPEIILANLFNNSIGRRYFNVPKGKKIYLITKSSVHFYTGEIAKNGMPIISTGAVSPESKNTFVYWLENWKPIHLCWLFRRMGWKIPKYFIGANTSATSPGTMLSDSTSGTIAWSNPNNAKVEDGTVAESGSLALGQQTYMLKATNFGFSIPSGATINGILTETKVASKYSTVSWNRAYIVKADGTYGSTNRNPGNEINTTLTYKSIGSSSDLWGETWTYADINDTDFGYGVGFYATTGGEFAYVDHMRITIYYTTSTNYPITAALGAFTLTGISANLKIGIKMVAALGTFALTSISTILKFGRKMIGGAEAFTLTGINATLLLGKGIAADVGTFVLTGVDATITSTRKIVGDVGEFILTGINSTLFVGHTIIASTGEFILTGVDAFINGFRNMVASVGEFTLTGINVTFPRASKVFVTVGEFILIGPNITFSAGRKIVAVLGEFTLTGVAALFPRASKVFATVGSFVLTGFSARGLLNGVSILWTAASKSAVSTMANISKNTSTWINKLKS